MQAEPLQKFCFEERSPCQREYLIWFPLFLCRHLLFLPYTSIASIQRLLCVKLFKDSNWLSRIPELVRQLFGKQSIQCTRITYKFSDCQPFTTTQIPKWLRVSEFLINYFYLIRLVDIYPNFPCFSQKRKFSTNVWSLALVKYNFFAEIFCGHVFRSKKFVNSTAELEWKKNGHYRRNVASRHNKFRPREVVSVTSSIIV